MVYFSNLNTIGKREAHVGKVLSKTQECLEDKEYFGEEFAAYEGIKLTRENSWVCLDFAYRALTSFNPSTREQFEEGLLRKLDPKDLDSRLQLPVKYVQIIGRGIFKSSAVEHAINAVPVDPSRNDFKSWVFFEPQSNSVINGEGFARSWGPCVVSIYDYVGLPDDPNKKVMCRGAEYPQVGLEVGEGSSMTDDMVGPEFFISPEIKGGRESHRVIDFSGFNYSGLGRIFQSRTSRDPKGERSRNAVSFMRNQKLHPNITPERMSFFLEELLRVGEINPEDLKFAFSNFKDKGLKEGFEPLLK